ncbi:guanidinobutyrase-like [Lytechinus variegatus]|uniref:guanidinobutyrase-like n=1 Tax=Lytechinus variegatus TaxID=7654 RepID=UPI001BB10DC4|nr:guanidinobutyrase-like [Lytechinus variegatus]
MFKAVKLKEVLRCWPQVRQVRLADPRPSLRSLCDDERSSSRRQLNEPLSGITFPRVGGISTMMRLPYQTDTTGLDACYVGVPLDIGTSYRSGTRLGPRQIRYESFVLGPCNYTGAAPFESLQVADIGDVTLNLYDLKKSCEMIREQYATIIANGCIPLTLGGDHTLTYPILQAIKDKYGPVGLVHIDAHDDVADLMFGEKIAHGTPFRRAAEEGCLDPKRVIQIGLRGSNYSPPNKLYQFQEEMGWKVVPAHRCWHKSMDPLMEKVRSMMGAGPVYLSFDIDSIDPGLAPGTGTPEIAGLTTIQALEIVRGCKGINLVGADLVEVSPAYDAAGTTALIGANLLFEMLCVLPGVKYYDHDDIEELI